MRVTVIIPVYNAEDFIVESVRSAITQPETAEVLLVEDGSSDRSLEVCEQLCVKYPMVKLLQHPNGENRGAGASRNLGIKNAAYEYIAFLDADDFFLPNRFETATQMFEDHSWIDGVYEAVGTHFEDEKSRERWLSLTGAMITTMKQKFNPEEFFEKQSPVGSSGYCPTGGWVVKRSIFEKTGYFDEHLRLHQDTAIFIKFSAVGKMMAGNLETPVAMRRVHAENRSSSHRSNWQAYLSHQRMWETLVKWSDIHLDPEKRSIIFQRFFRHALKPYQPSPNIFRKILLVCFQWVRFVLMHPRYIFQTRFWREMLNPAVLSSFLGENLTDE
jgi:glycosyltransferase involved in cell wall biosynthesis